MRRQLVWLLLLAVAVGLAMLAASHSSNAITEFANRDFASLTARILAVAFVGGLVIALFRERLVQAVEAALIWVAVAALLVLGYTYRFELRDVADKVLAELVPGRAAARGREVQLARGDTGDFQIATEVNGKRVPMVLDTGASTVVLTHDAAKAAGLPLEMIKYTVNIDTANGRTQAAAVTLDRIAIGGIVEKSVPALIAQAGQLKTSLLGMTFLNRLQSWEVRGDRLLLRGFP